MKSNKIIVHIKYIKESLDEMKKDIKEIKACVNSHDNRIQKLEDWRSFEQDNFNKNMAKWALIISLISVISSIIVAVLL